MNVHGYELITEWKNSQCGQTAKAKRGGKMYFLKKYQTPVEPVMNGALDAKTFAQNKETFRRFIEIRRRVNNALRPIAGPGGNIIIPVEDFIEDHHYMEAAELVDGVVDDEELEGIIASLSIDVKRLLMLTAAGALDAIHKRGVIHSDLKLKNVLLSRNSAGNYVAKVIDFDSSYFTDCLPDEIVGTIDYYSPELGQYSDAEDEREELGRALTTQSDIFSLGLIFHIYLAGEMPQAKSLTDRLKKRKEKGKPIYCWTILNSGCELVISDKITSLKYRSLIQDMLNIDPTKRPTATQVLQRIKAPEIEGVIEEPWPEHRLIVDKTKVKSSGYKVLKKISTAGGKKYELISGDGTRKECTQDDLVSMGFAKSAREERFCKPWDEHPIVFNETKLRSRGFVSAEQKTMSGIKGYDVFRSDSTATFFDMKKLVMMGYAIKKSEPVKPTETVASSGGFCTPWPEHAIEFDIDNIKQRGFVRSEQFVMSGIKGYAFFKADGSKQFIKSEMLVLLKMAKKK